MNKIIKGISILVIIGIISIFVLIRNDNDLKVPESERLSSIILVDVVGNKAVKKITIDEKLDIDKLLNLFSSSQRTSSQSVSELPEKTKFTVVLFKFKFDGTSWRSIYEEENIFYIDQSFIGVFKLNSNDLYILDKIIERGDKEAISIVVDNIGSIMDSVLK